MGKRLERAQSKAVLSSSLAATGAALGGPVGGAIGGLTGLIIGDETIVFPIDMVAVPAFEYASLTMGQRASMMIYIKEGEVLRQVQATDAQIAERTIEEDEAAAIVDSGTAPKKKGGRRKSTKYQKAYSKNFERLKPKFTLKSGKWSKGGFKKCVKAAHAATKKELK